MATATLRSNFRRIDPAKSSILLIEGSNRILPSFHETLSLSAAKRLEKLGVKVMTGVMVEKVDAHGVTVGGKRVESATVLWTAGVEPSSIVKTLSAPKDRVGRILVRLNVERPRHRRCVRDRGRGRVHGEGSRATWRGAGGKFSRGDMFGNWIAGDLVDGGGLKRPFRYYDKGNMAVVGKNFAVLQTQHLRLHGFTSWVAWALIHVMFLPQLQNRLRVQTQWLWSYITNQRGSRLIPKSGPVRERTMRRGLRHDLEPCCATGC